MAVKNEGMLCGADEALQLGTLLRSKRKIEELSSVIQEQRRQAGH